MTEWPKCFVYGLVDPRTKLVFYVGQTRTGIARPKRHALPKSVRLGGIKNDIIRSLLAEGRSYEIVLLDLVEDPKTLASWVYWPNASRNSTALHEAERWWIAYGRAIGWPLTNLTNGGEGSSRPCSAATREKIIARKLKHSVSAETREKISTALKGRRLSPEHVAKSAAGNRGRTIGSETRAKLSAATSAFYARHRLLVGA